MQPLIDLLSTLDLPPFMLTPEPGNVRVYFVTDLPIFKYGNYKDKQGILDAYNLDNISKTKIIHIGVSGKRIIKATKRKVYLGDSSITASLMQLVKAAQSRGAYDYPLLHLVYNLTKEDETKVSKRLKQHIHESARFDSRNEAIDYAEILKENFIPKDRRRIKFSFLKDLAKIDLDAEIQAQKEKKAKKIEESGAVTRLEEHARSLAKRSDEDFF